MRLAYAHTPARKREPALTIKPPPLPRSRKDHVHPVYRGGVWQAAVSLDHRFAPLVGVRESPGRFHTLTVPLILSAPSAEIIDICTSATLFVSCLFSQCAAYEAATAKIGALVRRSMPARILWGFDAN
jgi:hypothetical protein